MSPTLAEKYYKEAMTIGKAEGRVKGRAEGIAKGRAEGIVKGRAEGIAEGIVCVLRNRLDEPSPKLQKKIMSVKSKAKLEELLRFACRCVSLGEFETALN
jgi:flagellar biosynthesis/type III secretory pathway protein FliH